MEFQALFFNWIGLRQASIVRVACYFNMTCKYPDTWQGVDKSSQGDVETFKQLVRNISNANSEALEAGNTLNFNNIDQGREGLLNVSDAPSFNWVLFKGELVQMYRVVHQFVALGLVDLHFTCSTILNFQDQS